MPDQEIQLDSRRFLSGTALVVPLEQPEAAMVKSLMEPLQSFQEEEVPTPQPGPNEVVVRVVAVSFLFFLKVLKEFVYFQNG